MSALLRLADISWPERQVRFGPIAEIADASGAENHAPSRRQLKRPQFRWRRSFLIIARRSASYSLMIWRASSRRHRYCIDRSPAAYFGD
jgi:hypothetical protein